MLKRVISLMVGVCCLLAMTSAFAEMTYTGTTTVYDGDNVTVTSTVTGDAGDVATYLVYGNTVDEADELEYTKDDDQYTTSSNIVYLDQYAFGSNGASKTFRYTTAASNAGADIVVSGNGEVTVSSGAPAEIPAEATSITVKDSTGATWNTLTAIPTAEHGWYKIPYNSNQYIVSSVTVDGTAVSNWVAGIDAVWISATEVTLTKTSVITLGTVAGAASASTTSATYIGASGTDRASVVVVGDVDGDVDEFGVIVAKDQNTANAYITALKANWESGVTTGTNAQKLPALAKDGNGAFGIRIYDNNDFADQSQMVAIVYYYNGGALEVASNGYAISLAK